MADDIATILTLVTGFIGRMRQVTPRDVTVLIVDDEEAIRTFVNRVLSDAGYKTALAADGAEALEVAAKMERLDVLLTDVMMPGMQGDELARRVRQREPAVKVLYLTGYSDRLFKDKTTLWEDEAFLDKPCSVKGLLQAVALLLFGRVDQARESTS